MRWCACSANLGWASSPIRPTLSPCSTCCRDSRMPEHLSVEQEDRTVWLTFNRPEARNAMTFEMYEGLYDLCERLDKDPTVRVLVLRGAGDRAFVSGTDIRQFLEFRTREDALGYEGRFTRVLSRLHGTSKP